MDATYRLRELWNTEDRTSYVNALREAKDCYLEDASKYRIAEFEDSCEAFATELGVRLGSCEIAIFDKSNVNIPSGALDDIYIRDRLIELVKNGKASNWGLTGEISDAYIGAELDRLNLRDLETAKVSEIAQIVNDALTLAANKFAHDIENNSMNNSYLMDYSDEYDLRYTADGNLVR